MQDIIQTGLTRLGLPSDDALCQNYQTYIELLTKWNKTYNLTAIKGEEAMLNRHVFDSLSVYAYIEGGHCLDVGTGAGLPGLILAMAQPDKEWVLLDSNQKKLRFIQHVKTTLAIKNVEIVHARAEAYRPDKGFDTVICRAFTSMPDYIAMVKHVCHVDSCILAMKGAKAEEEQASIKNLCQTSEVIVLDVPGAEGLRTLIKVKQPL